MTAPKLSFSPLLPDTDSTSPSLSVQSALYRRTLMSRVGQGLSKGHIANGVLPSPLPRESFFFFNLAYLADQNK